MKRKHVQIRQWLLFVALVAVALYLHERYPIESWAQTADEQRIDDDASQGDVAQGPSSTPLATQHVAPSRRDASRVALQS
ncbi:hypothetical protein [Pararobbsia silviterrae]|uniref:Uncharacterized protein n=1 Tax=Pararobbsia silviterrae TaxID=1792498 RepID=A0A494YFT9_9BURK|nr:hypothetical protein [Pararobbsia silviterrae]RKP59213.1 hypothetical protein D7S86_04780 [Pararobbsia silviterrae]